MFINAHIPEMLIPTKIKNTITWKINNCLFQSTTKATIYLTIYRGMNSHLQELCMCEDITVFFLVCFALTMIISLIIINITPYINNYSFKIKVCMY